jgi:hypothetical protein
MTFEGSVIKEHGVIFGIAVVKMSAMRDATAANHLTSQFEGILGVRPVVLMAQDARGIPRYYGRTDIVENLANIDIRRIPWKKYTYV